MTPPPNQARSALPSQLAEALNLPLSIAQVLSGRGFATVQRASAFLEPSLARLANTAAHTQVAAAVDRLRGAIRREEPIAIYADRDVDGLTGLAVLARTLRTLGGSISWGSPLKGRGLEHEVLQRLLRRGAKVLILVDCGTGESDELRDLAAAGIDVIVADHHRFASRCPPAFAWIHPEVMGNSAGEAPTGCGMAFKLAQALWTSFLGNADAERLDYFLYSHLDLACLGVLADRAPLTGENRTIAWHGLRRLAQSRKAGLSALMRFLHLSPRAGPLTAEEVTWRLIPLLNAAGRLGLPELTVDLLLSEDPSVARDCIDRLLDVNARRRKAQDESLLRFERAVLEQCSVASDPVLVALASGLEPSVTGLAAQSMARKYDRPIFLFVSRGEHAVGSGRGIPGVDLFSWVTTQASSVVKYGGHQGAVGLTIRTADFAVFREGLLQSARGAMPGSLAPDGTYASSGASIEQVLGRYEVCAHVEGNVSLGEADAAWWQCLERLGPFGTGHPWPTFRLTGVESIASPKGRRSKAAPQEVLLKSKSAEALVRFEKDDDFPAPGAAAPGPWEAVGSALPAKKADAPFQWVIRKLRRLDHGS